MVESVQGRKTSVPALDKKAHSEDKMTKLEAIIRPSKFEAVKGVLTELGVEGMTISDVRKHGRKAIAKRAGLTDFYLLSKLRFYHTHILSVAFL
jgi:nitrogen regulatory protein P-II